MKRSRNSHLVDPPAPLDADEQASPERDQEPKRRGRLRSAEGKSATPNGRQKVNEDKRGKLSKETFFNRLKQLGDDDWDRFQVYVYRRWPRISVNDKPHYIGTHRTAVDEEFIRGNYGSGRYQLRLNDAKGTVDQTSLEIQDLSHPPKVSPDELIDCPENQRYFKLWPTATPKGADAVNGNDSAVRELAGVIKTMLAKKETSTEDAEGKKALSSLIDWALKQKEKEREQNSPGAFAGLVREIKDILPAPAPPAPAPPQPDMAGILRLAKELQPPPAPNALQLLEQAKGLFSPPQDDLAHIDRLLSIADKLGSLRGGGGGARSGWDTGLDYVRELIPLAPYIANAFGLRIPGMGAPAAPGATPPPAGPASFDPYARPDLLRQYAQALNGHAAAQGAMPASSPFPAQPPTAAAGAASSNDLLTVFQQWGALVVQALNNGVPGYDFADHLTGLLGTATHAMISAHGEEAIVRTMMALSDLALFGEPRLRTFTKEFIEFEAFLERMEQAETGAATTPVAG
jgi:hypothetical protein